MSDAVLTLQCADDLLSHQIRITLYEDDGTGCVEMILHRRGFRDRLRAAWRYLMCGSDCGVADVVLSKEQVFQLNQFLASYEYIDWKQSYEEQRKRELERVVK